MSLWDLLYKTDSTSPDYSEELIEPATADPLVFGEVVRAIQHENAIIRERAADIVEKVTRIRPLFLVPHRGALVHELSKIEYPEIRDRIALLYGRVFWDEWEMKQIVGLLEHWITTETSDAIIINSLTSLRTLAAQKEWIRPTLLKCLKAAAQHPNEPVKTFSEQLLQTL